MQVASLGGARYYVVQYIRLSLRFSVFACSALHRRRRLFLVSRKAVHTSSSSSALYCSTVTEVVTSRAMILLITALAEGTPQEIFTAPYKFVRSRTG